MNLANEHRTWRWYGVPPDARQAWIWGSDRDVPPEQSARDWRSRLLGVCRLNAFYLDDERCDRFTDILSEFRPQIIYGYATALAQYSRFLRAAGRRLPIEPSAIRSTAEVLLPEHRRLIEDQLGGPVLDYYGSREAGPIAGESLGCDGLHVFSDITYVEILRPDGAPCEPGEVGDVIVSKLHEHAMPFLRYRIGDRAAFLPDDEAGHGLPRISPVQGRVGDFIRTPNGRMVHGEFFTHLFYGVEGVTRFQIQQPEPHRLLILVQGNVERGVLKRIREAAAEHFGSPEPDAVSVESVHEILPGPSGKHRFVLPYEKPMQDS
jgi:phenylacetate-CoA ligase